MTTSLPIVNKVSIKHDTIYVNGVEVGYLHCSCGEVWVNGHTDAHPRAFVARFKYMKPKTKAKRFIKEVFGRISMDEYLTRLANSRSPRDVADAIGAEG